MNPTTARLLEMGLGGGLGALLGGGAGYMAGDEHDRPVAEGALLGGLAGAGAAGMGSLARRTHLADRLRSAAQREASEARLYAQQKAAPFGSGTAEDLTARLRGWGEDLGRAADAQVDRAAVLRASAEGVNNPEFAAAADASEQLAQRMAAEADVVQSLAREAFQAAAKRLRPIHADILGVGEETAAAALSRGRQQTRAMQGRLFGGRNKTSQAAHPYYQQQQPRPAGPLWGGLGAGASWLTATGLGERLGEHAGEDLVQRLRARAAAEVDPARAAALLDDAVKAKAIVPKAGLYGGALLGIPLALHVGKYISQSPRRGFMEHMP